MISERGKSLFFPQRQVSFAFFTSKNHAKLTAYEENKLSRIFFSPPHPRGKKQNSELFCLSTFKCSAFATFWQLSYQTSTFYPHPPQQYNYSKRLQTLFNTGKIIFFYSHKWFGCLRWTLPKGFLAKQRKEKVYSLHLATISRFMGKSEALWNDTTADML